MTPGSLFAYTFIIFILLSVLIYMWRRKKQKEIAMLSTSQPKQPSEETIFTSLIPPPAIPKKELPPVEPEHYHAQKILGKENKPKYAAPHYVKSHGHHFV
jgi:hypothetical protein